MGKSTSKNGATATRSALKAKKTANPLVPQKMPKQRGTKATKAAKLSRAAKAPAQRGTKAKKTGKPIGAKASNKRSPVVVRRNRDDFTVPVLRLISQEVNFYCSNPDCRVPTVGPSKQKGVSNIGVGAHITAAAPGGPRYDASLTPDERRSAANALWLCNSCGRLVDNDASTYTVSQLVQWKIDAKDRAQKALASGGRSTTEGLFAAHLEVQKETLAHQKQAHEAQMREQQLTRFSDMYSRFLEEAKAYAAAIEEYSNKMYVSGYRPDRPTRAAMQQPIYAAIDAMKRALQPILLADSDETRGKLRWELLRRRGFEPTVDTIENQRAYASWIHYHLLRLQDGITRLQDNVREALGHPPRQRSERDREFVAKSIAEAKAQADAVDADIKAQFEKLMREHQARAGAKSTTHASHAPDPTASSGSTSDSVRNRVWNVLHVEIFEDDEEDAPYRSGALSLLFVREIWRDVLALPIDEVPNDRVAAWKAFRQVFMTCAEQTFYGIVQHAAGDSGIREKLEDALEACGAPYRFVDGRLDRIASD